MFGTVGRAVVFLVSYERGEAAELDVAQPTEARVTVLHRGDDWGGFRTDAGYRDVGGHGLGGLVRNV